jgi:hypothetical protein
VAALQAGEQQKNKPSNDEGLRSILTFILCENIAQRNIQDN